MSLSVHRSLGNFILKGLPFIFLLAAGFFLFFSYFFWDKGIMPILPGIFTENITVPVNFIKLAGELIPIEMDNFLVFQNYESLPPQFFSQVTFFYGALIWILFLLGICLISTLKKMYFIGASALLIFLLTFSGINGLNIGGISSNYALIALISGTLIPIILLSFFGEHWEILPRFLVVAVFGTASLYLLGSFSEINSPWLWLAENAILPASIITVLFLLHIGHSVISGAALFLIKLNKGTGLKISYHLILIFLLYFLLTLFTLLDIMGEVNLPFPTIPPLFLMVIGGIMGFFVVKLKIQQTEQAFDNPIIGESFYLIGFTITVLTWGRAIFIENEPLYEFFNHVFLYGQISLSLLFFIYLMANFSEIINSGKDVEKIIFKPQHFAYFHMRIGAIMGLVILVVYADAIIAPQVSSASTNTVADYYSQTGRPLEAAILYENSWLQYRKNDKSKNAAAHIRFGLRQSVQGMDNLFESFDYSPNVPNILLLSSKLHQQNKIFDALFYLEKGLEYYPDNPYLLNNLALLYSKLNRPEDAIAALQKISQENLTAKSNKLALELKHGKEVETLIPIPEDLIYQINYLAYSNQKGDFAEFSLDTETLPEDHNLKTSLLRNQWSNRTLTPMDRDLVLVDSLIALEQMSFEERNYRETRILRTLQESHINETLKYINGTALIHSNSAGYYHAMAAKILAGQLDFEKAAVDISVAHERGFENFQPFHLAVLYFGNKVEEAWTIHQRFQVAFPSWMVWDDSGNLESNDLNDFFKKISLLHRQLPEDFLPSLEMIEDKSLREEFAYHIMVNKLHWLNKTEYEQVKKIILGRSGEILSEADIDSWYQFVRLDENTPPTTKISEIFQLDKGLDRNAYWAPFVWKKVRMETDELRKYEMLQEAIQFNKDPMLWIQYVKQSRKIGLDSYGSAAMMEMQSWLNIPQIEKLQMDNLN
jgi:tetratricopeptide (TPR) repeat protein